jgi:hypothetical protein
VSAKTRGQEDKDQRRLSIMKTGLHQWSGRSALSFCPPVLALALLPAMTGSASAATRYVDLNSASPEPPYTNWASAARTVQDAVDAATSGDTVVVTNGTYSVGGAETFDSYGRSIGFSRAAVTNAISLRSVNGPQSTVIDGGGSNRCVSLNDGASLSGFTVTNGQAGYSGGGGVWCASTNVFLTNCVIAGNSVVGFCGGGALSGTLYKCTLTGNSARDLSWNGGYGGGGAGSTLYNCTLSGNSARWGGAAAYSTLNNCILTGNLADDSGGGASLSTLNNCELSGNSATAGGGAAGSTLNNCTVTGNSAVLGGGVAGMGIVAGSTLNNCIVYFNSADEGPNYATGYMQDYVLNYCCTTPLPVPQQPWREPFVGNISIDPQLASASRLSLSSPCRGAGSAAYATGTDLDGEPWGTPPSIGCDEYYPSTGTGPLSVSMLANHTNVAVNFAVSLTAKIEGHAMASVWEFGDGITVTNRPYATHAWAGPGDYAVSIRAYNQSHPEGVGATITIRVAPQPVHFVAVSSLNPVSPYVSWDTAATNIQDAVDAASLPGALVLVSNGVYATGGRAVQGTMTNRLFVDKPVIVSSVNGPQFTVIQGYQVPGLTNGEGAIRCVYLGASAMLTGFTLTNGATHTTGFPWGPESGGGGVWCQSISSVVSNCWLMGNSAAAGVGGGAAKGTLYRCALIGNTGSGAWNSILNNCALIGNTGAGAWLGTLNNCTITGNSGGGAFATLNNCIVYFNTFGDSLNYDEYYGTLNYCCTTPLPTRGVGNISVDPQLASASHLSAASPCRAAGSAAYTTGADCDGEAWASPPSIGCDEYHVGAVTGPLSAAIGAPFASVAVGFPLELTALIDGRTTLSVWDFGDGVLATNQPYATHAWSTIGDRVVVLRAYNESHPQGVSAALTIHVVEAVHYVAAGSTNSQPPYNSWATAATNIQDAVHAVSARGALVLVSNGVYATGGRAVYGAMTNRVAVVNPLILQSVNGPEFTVIQGSQLPSAAIRCAYLATGARLSGFTLTSGGTLTNGHQYFEQSGGGVYCESSKAYISNCVVAGNSATDGGGGVIYGTLAHCTISSNSSGYCGGGTWEASLTCCSLSGNTAADGGGGAFYSTLTNCTLTGNRAAYGGGTEGGTLNDCTLTGNSASYGGGASGGILNDCKLIRNVATNGGASSYAVLNGCTLAWNSAKSEGGGAREGTLKN